ncbi:hypothetical protein [Achromobacter sp. 413638]|uniref:hypothetical protein n=1 Tax=Achromobacter sp. 413638 TaxID=3342385 RepID=UPI00370B6166
MAPDTPLPPTQATATPPMPQPRSKVELLFHEILAEGGRLTEQNSLIAAQLQEAALVGRGIPALLRQASVDAGQQIATTSARSLREAERTLAKADWDLRVTVRALAGVNARNAWRIGLLCAGCAFLGSILASTLVILFLR